MLVAGLTGSIGMGKSTVAARLRALGIAGCDADAEVHKLYEGAAVPAIEAPFARAILASSDSAPNDIPVM